MTLPDALLTKREVADLLKVTPRTLERWEKDGRLIPLRIGVNVRYRRVDVDRFVGERDGAA